MEEILDVKEKENNNIAVVKLVFIISILIIISMFLIHYFFDEFVPETYKPLEGALMLLLFISINLWTSKRIEKLTTQSHFMLTPLISFTMTFGGIILYNLISSLIIYSNFNYLSLNSKLYILFATMITSFLGFMTALYVVVKARGKSKKYFWIGLSIYIVMLYFYSKHYT